MLRKFDEIDVLEAVLEVKRSKVRLVVYLYICFLTINRGLVSAEMKAIKWRSSFPKLKRERQI